MGRQPMSDLKVQVHDGLIHGSGLDVVGQFTMAGQMAQGGVVRIVKQYVGRHQVVYIGNYDGEGTLFGTWMIDRLAGAWSIKLLRTPDGETEFDDIQPLGDSRSD